MLSAYLNLQSSYEPSVLCIGAHCDDIEIGCSGTVIRLLDAYPNLKLTWVILTGNSERVAEATASARSLVADQSRLELDFCNFDDGYLPYDGRAAKMAFTELKAKVDPDLIFCHWEHDRHQDHRMTSELTWNTFRNNLILEYEIPKYDGDLGSPNVFVPLSEAIMNRKTENIANSFRSQASKIWFDENTLTALHRIRAIESGTGAEYAEAFYCRKLPLHI